MAFDPSSTSVAQTTHLCCSLPGSNYEPPPKKKVQVWCRWLRGTEREQGRGCLKPRCRSWVTWLFDVCQTGGLCHSDRVGALDFKERNSSLSCSGPLTAGTTGEKMQSERRGGERWHPRLYDVGPNFTQKSWIQSNIRVVSEITPPFTNPYSLNRVFYVGTMWGAHRQQKKQLLDTMLYFKGIYHC